PCHHLAPGGRSRVPPGTLHQLHLRRNFLVTRFTIFSLPAKGGLFTSIKRYVNGSRSQTPQSAIRVSIRRTPSAMLVDGLRSSRANITGRLTSFVPRLPPQPPW